MAGPLFLSLEPFAPLMAGPAVRCRELAAACAADGLAVTVAVPEGSQPAPAGCDTITYDPLAADALADQAAAATAVVAQGAAPARFPALVEADVPLALDLYCPFLIEHLERDRQTGRPAQADGDDGALAFLNDVRGLNTALARGDYFLCADARQRDYWLGALSALHRLVPNTYRDDPLLHDLIATVPFGCPAEPPPEGGTVLRGRINGIAPDAEIILWGGSLSPWFDTETLLRAVAVVRETRPAATLVLLGTHHPSPDVPESPEVGTARSLADELGLTGSGVHFLPWVAYAERGRYLAEAALGVSTHSRHLEAHFAFRTRLVDYLWAGLPMVVTRGDALSTRCAALGAALAVEPGDVEALAQGLRRGLEDAAWREHAIHACGRLAGDFTWARVAQPLRAWLANPRRAADATGPRGAVVLPPAGTTATSATADELAALHAEAARARALDARLRAVDRKLKVLETLPGVGRLLRKRREG